MRCRYAPLVVLLLAGALHAQPVTLEFVQARFDGDESAGLDGTEDLVLSPDGRFAYASSYFDDAVTVLERDPTTNALTLVQAVYDEEGGVTGLFGPVGLAMSADGAYLYVAAEGYATVFSRDDASGRLTFVQTVEDEEDGALLQNATEIALSPDGDNVYVASDFSETLTVLARNATTGRLSVVQALENDEGGVVGLDDPSELIVSPDGAYLYAANGDDGYVSVFARAPATGSLSYVGQVEDGVGGVDGIDGAEALLVSADGRFLYATGRHDDALAVFSRDASSGALTFVAAYRDGQGGVDGLTDADGLAMSADEAFVYAVGGSASSAFDPGTVAVFARDATSGTLAFVETLRNTAELRGAGDVAVTPDGSGLLVAARFADAVSAYDRDPSAGTLQPADIVLDGAGGIDLRGAQGVAITPDGRHVYAVGGADTAINIFERDAATGTLAFVGVLRRDDLEPYFSLDGITASLDGAHVYVAARDALLVFSRDATTGALTFVEAQVDGQGGVDGLSGARRISISPDGAHLYVSGTFDNALAVFARDTSTGALTFVEVVRDGQNGVDGLNSAAGVEVSPDGQNVYATGRFDDAVAVFSRDPSTGALTFVEVQQNGTGGVDGLDNAESVRVSPDGAHVIATGPSDNALAVFSRDASTGALTFVEVVRDGVGGAQGLGFPWDLAVSPDGTAVFVASSSGTLASYSRDASTGLLTFADLAEDDEGPVVGLGGARHVVLSPDGRHEYVTAGGDGAVVVFANSRPVPTEAAPAGGGPLVLSAPSPNPATDGLVVRLTLREPEALSVDLLDALGRRVAVLHEEEASAGAHEIAADVSALPSGVYVLRARAGAERQTRRVVVVR